MAAQKRQWNRQFLNQYCMDHNIEYDTIPDDVKINRNTPMSGKCKTHNCKGTFSKIFRSVIEDGGPHCKSCCKKNSDTKKQETCMKNHGVKRPLQSPTIMKKLQQTVTDTHGEGITNVFQSSEIKEKIKKVNIDNHGVVHNSQREDVKQKLRDKINSRSDEEKQDILQKSHTTSLLKYGENSYAKTDESKQRSIRRNMKKFGVPNQLQYYSKLPKSKQKTQDTNFKKYGVRHPMQNATIADKASKKSLRYYNYTFPSGRIDRIQGYENFALNELILIGIHEDDIITKRTEVPEVWWFDAKGIKHRYYVDTYIKSQQLCIESKSPYTAEQKGKDIFIKQQAVKDAGFYCEIWVYDRKGNKVECHK